MFPSWDSDSLRDVLESSRGDVDAAAELLLQWSEEGEVGQASRTGRAFTQARLAPVEKEGRGWSGLFAGSLLGCCTCSGRGYSDLQELPGPLLVPRPDFDGTMARRLNRQYSASKALYNIAHLKHVIHERAKVAKAHVAERKRLRRCDSQLAHCVHEDALAPDGCSSGGTREEEIARGKRLLAQRLEFLNLVGIEMKERHKEVRSIAVSHRKENPDTFSVFFEPDEWQRDLQTMSEPKTWGDELTLRAVCDALCVKIHVVTTTDENWYLHYDPSCEPVRQLFLTYVSPIHYNTMRPKR
jgi:hypothetical protein